MLCFIPLLLLARYPPISPMSTYVGGPPFVFEDHSSGTFVDTILHEMYGRMSLQFTQTMARPGRDVTMIRVINEKTTQSALVPNAVLDFTQSTNGSIGSVMFPPKSNIPMETYVRRVSGSQAGPGRCVHSRPLDIAIPTDARHFGFPTVSYAADSLPPTPKSTSGR